MSAPAAAGEEITQAPGSRAPRSGPWRGLLRVVSLQGVVTTVLLVGVFLASARLFTWHNSFSYRFHPDEHTKARQIQSGEYNFYHPQLLFRGAQAMLLLRTGTLDGRIEHEPRDKLEVPLYNRILRNARTASALFAAGAVVLLALTARWQRGITAADPGGSGLRTETPPDPTAGRLHQTSNMIRGLAALLVVVLSVMACPSLLANAHFAKEDAALVLGVAAWVAAGSWFAARPTVSRALLFAAACGLVVSGKWIGGVLSLTGLAVIAIRGGGVTARDHDAAGELPHSIRSTAAGRLGLVLAAALTVLLVVLLVNAPVLWQFDRLVAGLRYEAVHVASDHQGLIANAPVYYLEQLWREIGWPLLLLAVFELAMNLATCRRRAEAWMAPLAALVLFATISSTRIVNPRYLLPVTVLFHYFAALGALRLAEVIVRVVIRRVQAPAAGARPQLPGVPASAAAGVIALALILPMLAPLAERQRGMLWHLANDQREALQRWAIDPSATPRDARVLETLPRDARLLQEHYVAMERWAVPFELHSVRSVVYRLPEEQAVLGHGHAGLQTLGELAAEGYTHIAIAEDRYARFFDPRIGPTAQYRQDYERTRAMYEQILRGEGVALVYEYIAPPNRPEWINPTIRIYRLTGETPSR